MCNICSNFWDFSLRQPLQGQRHKDTCGLPLSSHPQTPRKLKHQLTAAVPVTRGGSSQRFNSYGAWRSRGWPGEDKVRRRARQGFHIFMQHGCARSALSVTTSCNIALAFLEMYEGATGWCASSCWSSGGIWQLPHNGGWHGTSHTRCRPCLFFWIEGMSVIFLAHH